MGMAGGWREMGKLEKWKHLFIKSKMTGDVETISPDNDTLDEMNYSLRTHM
jgi:hypothetical protein